METLHTERLVLVPLDPARHAASLHVMLSDPEMTLFGGPTVTATVEETRAKLTEWLTGNGGWTWAITSRPSTEAIGTIGLFHGIGDRIRGLDRYLRRDHWGRGLMSEAARAVVPHLLAQQHIDGLEAWIDSRNARSLGVARHAGLDQVGRLPRVYDDHIAQQIVMARAAEPRDPETLAFRPMLIVRDLDQTARLLTSVLGLRERFRFGDPPNFAELAVAEWTASPSMYLQTSDQPITPTVVAAAIGISTDVVLDRAGEAGLDILEPIEDKPWHSREFTFALPDGHRIRVIGPPRPSHQTAT